MSDPSNITAFKAQVNAQNKLRILDAQRENQLSNADFLNAQKSYDRSFFEQNYFNGFVSINGIPYIIDVDGNLFYSDYGAANTRTLNNTMTGVFWRGTNAGVYLNTITLGDMLESGQLYPEVPVRYSIQSDIGCQIKEFYSNNPIRDFLIVTDGNIPDNPDFGNVDLQGGVPEPSEPIQGGSTIFNFPGI